MSNTRNRAIRIFALISLLAICLTGFTQEVSTSENRYGIEKVNNEKWEVNSEMMIHIRMMESDIQRTSEDEEIDYDELELKLKDHISDLTSSCTMKGKAHDELHKWLIPVINLVKELSSAESREEKDVVFQQIEFSMLEFNKYFR
ncbi:MAG: hypothetical protein R2813_10915 [Flavobacteriales bacterium]